jgi:hypothetical protein
MEDRLFFEDGSILAEWAATHSLAEVEAGEKASAERAAQALALSHTAHEAEATAQQGANELSDRLVQLRNEHEALTEAYYNQAYFEADTVNHASASEAYAKRSQVISAVTGAIAYGRESLAPGLRFEVLKADEMLFRESAQLASWSAGRSAVQRHILAVPLGDAEGGISFGNFGKTHDLLIAALTAHSRAADAVEARMAFQRAENLKKELH